MIKSLIIGAGSIGNHLANAARSRSWQVSVYDIDKNALKRMKNEIYPSRYSSWDNDIKLIHNNIDSDCYYDVILLGTPPDTHVKVAIDILKTQKRGKSRDLSLIKDYDTDNVSEKVVRIILSHTDFVNKYSWKKY